MRTPEKANKLWLVVCAAVAIGLYTPGIIWLLLATFILGRHSIKNMVQIVGRLPMAFGVMAGIIILLPLARAIFLDPQLVNNILLIPNDWPPLVEALKSIAWSGLALVWHTRGGIDIVIDRLALLNLAQIILSVFGIYALLTRVRRVTLVAFGWLAFSIVVAGINTDLHLLSIGLPAVFLFMSAGLRFLYLEWRRIFPLNPFARALSITLILLVIGVHGAYGVRYALAAWPQTEATKKSYVLQ